MSQKMPLKYTVVVPAFREESIIDHSLTNLAAQLRKDGLWEQTEVIVVSADPGSDKRRTLPKRTLKILLRALC